MARLRVLAFLVCAASAACFERGGQATKVRDDAAPPPPPIPASAIAGPAEPEGAADPQATIRVALEAEPLHLNPLVTADAIAGRVAMGDVYEGLLCQRGATDPATPCLAASVDRKDGGKRWLFRLRADARWHDGRPVTTADVRFTYELLAKGTVTSWLTSEVSDLIQVDTPAPGMVQLRFRESRLGRRNAFARIPILPVHRWKAVAPARFARSPLSRRPVGTGPLRVTDWRPGEAIELTRFDGYWGDKARAARIVYHVVSDRQRARNLLATGKLDLVVQVPIDDALRAAAAHSTLVAFSYDTPAYLAAVHNLRRPALADPRVRRALTLLLDRGGVVDRLFRGLARIITGPLLPGSPDRDPSVRALAFDRAAARALLEAAGKRGASLTLMVPAGSRTMGRIADVWAADARPHLSLSVAQVPFADMLARLREGRFDVALMAFTTAHDVDLFTRFHSTQVGAENYGAVRDPALDKALVAVRAAPDAAARRLAQRMVHRRVHELQAYTFIASDVRAGLAHRSVGGLGASGGAMPRARYLWKPK